MSIQSEEPNAGAATTKTTALLTSPAALSPYYSWSNNRSSCFQTIAGGTAILSCICIWLLSLASPLLLCASVFHRQYIISAIIVMLTIIAYLPWKKGFISSMITGFARQNPMYYKKCSIILKDRSISSSNTNTNTNTTNNDATNRKGNKPNLYAVHPHGAFCLGWSVLFCSPLMTSVRFCFSPVLYVSPFFRLWSRLAGKPGAADKASMISYMIRGEDIALPPGGFEEATLTSPDHDRVYIKKRVGFVKLALQHGYNIVPVYSFGENKTYLNVQGAWKARLKLNSFGIPAIVVYGASFLPLLPRRVSEGVSVVVGFPLELPKIEDPSREEVKMWHDKYIAALIKVFEDHKCEAYGSVEGRSKKMELWQ